MGASRQARSCDRNEPVVAAIFARASDRGRCHGGLGGPFDLDGGADYLLVQILLRSLLDAEIPIGDSAWGAGRASNRTGVAT